MTVPNGSAGVTPGDYGVTNDGTVPGMNGRTQSVVSTQIKGNVAASPGWKGGSNTFFGTLMGGFSNGISGFISGAVSGLTGAAGNFLDFIGSLLGIKNTADGANTKATNIGQAVLNGALGVVTTVESAINGAMQGLFATATTASATAIQAQLGVQQLQTTANGNGSGGQSRLLVFSGSDGSALSTTDFTGSGITIRGSQGFAGIASASASNSLYAMMLNYPYDTDNESVSFVVGDSGNQYTATTALLRCNVGGTVGAYCQEYNNQIKIGYFTSRWNFSSGLFTSQSLTVAAGNLIEFRAAGLNYYVLVNGTQQMSFTDTGSHVTQGSASRYCGFVMERASGAFGVVYDSSRLASLAMSDIALPGVSVTPSWHLSRSSSSSVSLSVAINAGAVIPASFFTTQDYSNQATVTTLGTGKITITKAGFYWLQSTIQTSSAYSNYSYWCIFVNGAQASQGIPTGVPHMSPYLNVGDTIQPGVFAEGRTITGTSSNNIGPQDASITTLNGGPGIFFSGIFFAS